MTKQQTETPKQNNALSAARKRIIIQSVIAIQTVIITVLLIFGMSAAWYTNVVQTSGLHFQAEAWGFDGEVFVSEDPIEAAPGKSDVVGLRVTNAGKDMVDVSVRVSKEQMDEEMQKRLFFYVDTTDSRNGETLNRVYVNSRDSYTYTMLANSKLYLTGEQANDVPLKWQWVYDMLGYYFYGTVTNTVDANNAPIVSAQVEDYLRPVEYDLDTAKFDENGMLTEANGESLLQFIYLLYARDGYAGDDVEEDTSKPGYYKIDVDENGHGIWMYLCNWEEIQQATAYDSQLGIAAAQAMLAEQGVLAGETVNTDGNTADENIENVQTDANGAGTGEGTEQTPVTEEGIGDAGTEGGQPSALNTEAATPLVELPQNFMARLILIGQVAQREYKNVTTVSQLEEQLNSGGTVRLNNTLTLNEPLVLSSVERAVLDLNGHKIIGPNGGNTIRMNANSDLTVMNGEISGIEPNYDIVSILNADLTLDHVTISGEGDDAIAITDEFHSGDSTVRISNSTIDVNGCAVYVRGNGENSEKKTRIIVENTKMDSGYVAIMGNGSEVYWGTEIYVSKSELNGYYAAVYQPQSNSLMTLVDCKLTGDTAVVAKGGDMVLENCEITSTGGPLEPEYQGSGFTQTGDAVFVDCSYGVSISVKITGNSTVTSQKNLAVRAFVPEDMTDCAEVKLYGGTYTPATSAIAPEGYSLEPYIADGYILQYNASEKNFVVTEAGLTSEEPADE